MMQYIAEAQGLWYEGSQSWLRRIQSHPIILPFSVVGKTESKELLFLEDYFNSTTRIRRGRLFQKDDRNSWPASVVSRFPNSDLRYDVDRFDVNRSYKTADVQIRHGDEIELGDGSAGSRWIVVLSERIGLEGHYVTIKSKTFFGVLPELLPDQIPQSNKDDVLGSIEAVVDAASIQAPQSVIDACRNAACHLISAKFPASNPVGKQDLGKLVGWLAKNDRKSCGSAGSLINSLHSRAKVNAAVSRGTRPISGRDAELALSSLAFLLQDFGWGTQ